MLRRAFLAAALLAPVAAPAQTLTRRAVTEDAIAPAHAPPGYDVTIVEFADYQCGYCRKMAPVLAELIRTDPKVRIVYRDWPIFGPASRELARLAIASRWQGRHDAFHNALLTAPGQLDAAAIRASAARAKVDWPRLERDLTAHDEEIDALLGRNDAIARALGLRGTPALIVGRQIVPGAVDGALLRRLVADARKDG